LTDDLTPPGSVKDPEHALVRRLSRPHPSGGVVIERAAILAAGSGSGAVLAWITAHGGKAELAVDVRSGGLHADRVRLNSLGSDTPRRYVLPAGAL
jgi:hypothetical protein